MSKVFVTGIGLVSAIGNNAEEHLVSLQNSKTGIQNSKYFHSKYADIFPFGEIKLSNAEMQKELGLKNGTYTRTDFVAFKAFKEAIQDAAIENLISSRENAFISASTVGGMCETDRFYADANLLSKDTSFADSYSGINHLLEIVKQYNIKGNTMCINTACSSSANAIMLGTKMIKTGMVKRAVVGGVDTLSKFTVNGFNALQIFSKNPCTPFDKDRKGLNLGEAAAYLVLEREEDCQSKKKYAEIVAYGNSNDAYHASSLSDEAIGIVNAMKGALGSANLSANDIDYINTHGTATENNDYAEMFGITKLFKKVPPFNSTKSYTGHTLAAAGALEAIFSIFSINNKEIYKSLNVKNAIEPFNLLPISKYQKNIEINTVLSNSFGFAGNCSSLILKKCT